VYKLSETIRARRKELGLTLDDLAAIVGVTPGALSHVESGRRLPDARNAVAVANAMRLDPDEILTLLDLAHAERRASQVGRSKPNERHSSAHTEPSWSDSASVFHAMPIEAMFAESEDTEGDALDNPIAMSGLTLHQEAAPPHLDVASHRRSIAPSPRDRARYSPGAAERLAAAEELAEQASRAIRTLRGMLLDDDPGIAHEARRLLRELDVRGVDER
jgi:transcriptional regulator with XRE-family HTH domain